MRFLVFLPVLFLVALVSCDKPASQTQAPEEKAKEPVVVDDATDKKRDSSKTEKAGKTAKAGKSTTDTADTQDTPTPPEKRLAPDGVYFVTERLSFITDEGSFTIRAGTRVTLVKNNGATMDVSDGKQQFAVQSHQVTNDLDVAKNIGAAAATEAAAASAANRERSQQAAEFTARKQAELGQAQANGEAAALRKQKETRLAALKQEESLLNAKIEEANVAERKQNYSRRILDRTVAVPSIVTQRPANKARLVTVQNEIARLESELR